jgi:DNA-binding transcriptional LysR family regulator
VIQPFHDFVDVALMVNVRAGGSIHSAARMCQISQPAASRRLRLMERRVGVNLHIRSKTGTVLSGAGEFWAGEAQRLLISLEEAAARFAEWKTDAKASVRIAASYAIADYLLPAWFAQENGRAIDPAMCHVLVGNNSTTLRWVLEGEAEVGVLGVSDRLPAGLGKVILGSDRLVLVVNPSHSLARRRRPLPLASLCRTSLIWRESDSGTTLAMEQVAQASGIELAPPALRVGSAHAVKSAVMRGLAPAVVTRVSVAEELRTGRLVEVSVEGLDIVGDVCAVHNEGKPLSDAARLLISELKTYFLAQL